MNDLFPPSIDDALAELRRELAMRPRVYARLVDTKRIRPEQAARQIAALQKALECLEAYKAKGGT